MPKLSSFILLIPLALSLAGCAPEFDKRKEGEAREKQKAAKEAAKKGQDSIHQRLGQFSCDKKESDVPVSIVAQANAVTVDYRVNDPKKLNCDGSLKDSEQNTKELLRFIGDTVDVPIRSWPQGATAVTFESKRTCLGGRSTITDYNSSTQKLKIAIAQISHANPIFGVVSVGRNVLSLKFLNAQGAVVESSEILLNYYPHNSYDAKALVAKEKRCKKSS